MADRTITLPHLHPETYRPVASQLQEVFYSLMFAPLIETMNSLTSYRVRLLQNSEAYSLLRAIRSGQVQYNNGIFSGSFSAAISRQLRGMGATFDKRQKVFHLPSDQVPDQIRAEAGAAKQTAKQVHEELKKTLDRIQKNLSQSVTDKVLDFEKPINEFERGFKKASTILKVPYRLSEDSKKKLAADYNENMRLWIKKFTEETIQELRADVEDNALQGYRFDRLAKIIQSRYSVSSSKAKFLARNETAIFMSKFREARFKEGGVRSYKWSTSRDERVRPDHKDLEGLVVHWSSPPIVDKRTGARAHAGEYYQCRCVALPIIPSFNEVNA